MGVATRGVKFKFAVDERVLCYEPDPTKAKVLYESKVMQLVIERDDRGRKVPEYLIHFFGWNSSWDRCVKEEFILPYTEENRALQDKLAEEAATFIKGKRKCKLPPLIKGTLNKKLIAESANEKPDERDTSITSSESESSESDYEKEVILNIPDNLKQQLNDDWRLITKNNNLVKLPSQVNVIMILEAFVKYLAAKLLSASPPRNSQCGKQFVSDDVQSELNLAKEAMHGIRVYFDFTLPHLLLYRQEKKQYYTDGTVVWPVNSCFNVEGTGLFQNMVIEIEPGTSEAVADAPSSPSKKEADIPSLPRPQKGRPRVRRKSEKVEETSPKVTSPIEKPKRANRGRPRTTSTRVLRSSDRHKAPTEEGATTPDSALLNGVVPTSTPSSTEARTAAPQETTEYPAPISPSPDVRVTRKSAQQSTRPPVSPPSLTIIPPEPQPSTSTAVMDEKPPLGPCTSPIPHTNSSASSIEQSSASAPLSGQEYRLKQLQEILSWHMLPPTIYNQIPAPPSLIYGAQHLLRLFVKLPTLLSTMTISSHKLQIVMSILEKFLTYMSEQKDSLFLSNAYEDSSEELRGS